MKWFRKILCQLIGHNYRCLHRNLWEHHDGRGTSTSAAWKCQRCGNIDETQWDG